MTQRPSTAAFTALYAAQGAPVGFIWWTLPALLRADGLAVEAITGLTAVLLLPWIFKFAWAPLVDAARGPRWGFRAWIASAQTLMGLTLVPLIWLDPTAHLDVWRALLLTHAFAAATQDVAIDALAINSVAPHARGWLNGCMQAGMLTGRSVFGGAALFAATSLGREAMLAALVTWIWLGMSAVAAVSEPPAPEGTLRCRMTGVARALRSAMQGRLFWFGMAFALTSAAAFEATGQLAGPYLIDRAVRPETVGLFFGVFVVGATLAGGLAGGHLSDRWGRRRAAGTFLVGFVAVILLLAALDSAGVPAPALMGTLVALYFTIGLFTAASYALYMDLADTRAAGTQFSAFMAATNACESWSAFAGGRIAGTMGYPTAFIAMSAASLLSLPLLRRLTPAFQRLK